VKPSRNAKDPGLYCERWIQLFCLFLAWELFNVISAAGEQQKLIIASLKFESIKKMGLRCPQRWATVDSKALVLNR
jgi:hypothetical protein